ncbi:MAG: hypothetical protein EOO80_18045 [Oxalobacteraceae bacterium]|nr:MAG: hypothetical protein EOO80_18045 [Oxalobacteraceae bacterium]
MNRGKTEDIVRPGCAQVNHNARLASDKRAAGEYTTDVSDFVRKSTVRAVVNSGGLCECSTEMTCGNIQVVMA